MRFLAFIIFCSFLPSLFCAEHSCEVLSAISSSKGSKPNLMKRRSTKEIAWTLADIFLPQLTFGTEIDRLLDRPDTTFKPETPFSLSVSGSKSFGSNQYYDSMKLHFQLKRKEQSFLFRIQKSF